MKAKKSANSKVPSRALHAKSRKDSCTNNVHPDVILDADEALRNILGRLTKLEDEVAPIKTENKELKKRNGYLESQHRQDLAKIKKQNAEICTLKARLDKRRNQRKIAITATHLRLRKILQPPRRESVQSHCVSHLARSQEVSQDIREVLCKGKRNLIFM